MYQDVRLQKLQYLLINYGGDLMDLSNNLISQFAKITKDQNGSSSETIVYGTAVSYGDKLYVNIDGSDSITPVVTTSEVKAGERVTILLKDHSATILGNVTNPAASTETVGKVLDEYDTIVARIGDFELIIADKVTTEQLQAELAVINEALIGKATIEQLNAVEEMYGSHLKFNFSRSDIYEILDKIGNMPLPPYIKEKLDDKNEAKTSFFQRLFERIESADRENLLHTLEYNYRAERRICDLYSNAFYEGKLKTTDAVNAKKGHSLSFASSVVWYDTGKLQDKEDKQQGTGKINPCNVTIIKRVLSQLKDEMIQKNTSYDIGIIAPYKAQTELLRNKLAIKKDFADYKIDIGTVDSFQGSDRDIIIYDCVRSSKLKQKAKIDFIAEEKRLNVSLSRAKLLLIIVGDMDFLHQAQVSDKNNPFARWHSRKNSSN